MTVVVGVDTGGTFTDVVAIDAAGRASLSKVETTSADPSIGIVAGSTKAAAGVALARLVHGTTVATNAVLERRGARTALLTTAGFEDVLEIGRLKRSVLYDLQLDQETPGFLSPRHLRFGIPERVGSEGQILKPLDETAVVKIAHRLAQLNVESIAVCLLFSFRNPAHERRVQKLLAECLPGIPISVSSELDPVFREYERTCVTAFNAYVAPLMSTYLSSLSSRVGCEVDVMQSRGSVVAADRAAEVPVTTLLSGPAAGVLAASEWARRVSRADAIGFDMGGTSTDVSVILGGEPILWREGRIGVYPVRTPMIAVHTIGAGGGSIGWLDGAGELRVGPKSAGSTPGPAAYGKGGTEPTVTDASLFLGYLGDHIAGGAVGLQRSLAESALARVGTPEASARAIHRIVNARMADQVRLVTVRRGISPTRLVLIAFGGAGPMHAVEVARELDLKEVVIPRHPGVLSAEGLLLAPSEQEHVASGRFSLNEVPAVLQSLISEHADQPLVQVWADMRYLGQSHELPVRITFDQDLREAFERVHEDAYGYRNPLGRVEAMGVRIVTRARDGHRVDGYVESDRSHREPASSTRRAWFSASGWIDAPVVSRRALRANETLHGPMLIEDHDATAVLPPESVARVDASGALLVTVR